MPDFSPLLCGPPLACYLLYISQPVWISILRAQLFSADPSGLDDQEYRDARRQTLEDAMIHFKEEFHDDYSVTIHVAGVLDRDSMPLFKSVCERLMEGERQLSLDLNDLFHICRDGMQYLAHIHSRVEFSNIPEFLKRSFNSHGQWGNNGAS